MRHFGAQDGKDGPRTQDARCTAALLLGLFSGRKTSNASDLASFKKTRTITATAIERPEARYIVVSQSCQMAFLVTSHRLKHVYAVSTGAGLHPENFTPNGRFTILSKQSGYHQSTLYPAKLYDPMCFTRRGDCLHGFASVPSHPASHGCVRFSIDDIMQLYPVIHDGDPVYVTGKY